MYVRTFLLTFVYRYFGAAKDLPGVRELFEQERESLFCCFLVVVFFVFFLQVPVHLNLCTSDFTHSCNAGNMYLLEIFNKIASGF